MSDRSSHPYPINAGHKRNRSGRVFARIGDKKIAINLGVGVPKKQRDEFNRRFKRLVSSHNLGITPEVDVTEWLGRLSDPIYAQLQRHGLCSARAERCVFADFVEEHFARRIALDDIEEGTTKRWRTACKHARGFFGDAMLDEVTEDHAKAFRSHLLKKRGHGNKTMSETTVRKTCSIISEPLLHARKKGVIKSNPFDCVPKCTITNPDSQVVVPASTVIQVIEFTKNPEDKIAFALGRFAGVRGPSEIVDMRWSHVDLENGVLSIKAKKTKRYGKEWRRAPMMPPLIRVFLACKPAGAADTDFVLPRLRLHTGLSVRMGRLCEKAGVAKWAKMFVALRKSYSADMSASHSPGDVAAWLGNKPQVLIKHYWAKHESSFTDHVGSAFVAAAVATSASGGNRGGSDAENAASLSVATGVASVATSVGHEVSNASQPPSDSDVATSPDESCSPVTSDDGRAEVKRNGRYWTTKTGQKHGKNRKGRKPGVATGVAGAAIPDPDTVTLAQLISRQPQTVQDLIRSLLTAVRAAG